MMMNALLLLLALAAPGWATGVDRTTPNYGFIAIGSGTVNWAAKMNGNWDNLDSILSTMTASTVTANGRFDQIAISTTANAISTSALRSDLYLTGNATGQIRADLTLTENATGALDLAKVNRAGDTMTGQLTLNGSTLTIKSVTGNNQYAAEFSTGIKILNGGGVRGSFFAYDDGTISTTAGGGGGGGAGETNTYTSSKTFTQSVLVIGTMTASTYFIGTSTAIKIIPAGGNPTILIGPGAGDKVTTGYSLFAGRNSGQNSTAGVGIVGLGDSTCKSLTGNFNTCIGYNAGGGGSGAAGNNTIIGANAGANITSGVSNLFLGDSAGASNTSSSGNTYLGQQSGYNATGALNVFLGYNSGYNETGSNKLYIENSTSASPLIWGDFNTNSVMFNSTVTVTGQDASGFSVKVASGINASAGCITLQGGQVCGPSGGSGGGHTIATGTLVGPLTSLPTETKLAFDSQYFNLVDTPTLNATFVSLTAAGGGVIGSTNTEVTGSLTNTSFNGVCLVSTATVTVSAGSKLLIGYSGIEHNSSGNGGLITLLVDGKAMSSSFSLPDHWNPNTNNNGSYPSQGFTNLTSTLSAGTHNICLTGYTGGGTLNFYTSGLYQGNQIWAVEIPTFAGGGISASTQTILTGSYQVTGSPACINSGNNNLTMTTGNVPVDLKFTGGWSIYTAPSGNENIKVWIWVDGSNVWVYNSTYAMAAAAHNVGGYSIAGPLTIDVRTPTLSAGSHTFCVALKMSSTNDYLSCGGAYQYCSFEVREAR